MGTGTTLRNQIAESIRASSPADRGERKPFNEIILDDDETAEALRSAREDKFFRLKRIEYMQQVTAPREIKTYTFDELFTIIQGLIKIDEDNESVVRLLCMYATGDERFELEGYKLSKGICLFGGVGVGKTTLMRILSRNQIQSYVMVMCRQIEDEFSRDGDIIFRTYSMPRLTSSNGNPFGHQRLGYCFDDLGTEPISKYYGKESNVMAEIILNRYDHELPYNETHITTNLTIEMLGKRYGARVTDRMRQMFNLIFFPVNSKSRRQ